jgi:hypothetical protein
VARIFQTESNKIKLLKECENVTQKVLFGNTVFAALMPGRKYDVIPQNGECSRESNVGTSVLRNKSPLSKRNVVTELNMDFCGDALKTPVTSLDEMKLRIVHLKCRRTLGQLTCPDTSAC